MTRVVVAGIGESDYGIVPGSTDLGLAQQAAARALADAGLQHRDVDGIFSCAVSPELYAIRISEYLGMEPRYIDSTHLGGAAWEVFVEHAVGALKAGLCDVALLTYGSAQRSQRGRTLGTGNLRSTKVTGPAHFDAPYGCTLVGEYALAASRYMHEYGVSAEELAAVAVSTRNNAAHNPLAMYRDPISIDDVLASRMIADPLHLLDCCVISDGGGAVVLVRDERVGDLPKRPIRVLGTGSATSHISMTQIDDLARLACAERAGRRAFERALLTPADVDVVEVYDSFTITVLLTLEALGLCGRGEAGKVAMEGALEVGGSLPTNTDGGGLSSNHPGMRGVFLLIEAVRQLRHEAGDGQVRDAEIALCHGTGGTLSACGTVILGVA